MPKSDPAIQPQPNEDLLAVLCGLVPIHIMRLQDPRAAASAYRNAEKLADVIAESGDRLTNAGTFQSKRDREARAEVLSAMATTLALGAMNEGGVTWAGAHWCTAPHPNCPAA